MVQEPDVSPTIAASTSKPAPIPSPLQQQYNPPPTAQAARPPRFSAERAAAPPLLADEDLNDDDDPSGRGGAEQGGLHLVNVAGLGDASRSVIMPYYADVVALAEAATEDDLAGGQKNGFVSTTVAFLRSRQAAIVASVGVGALILGTVGAQSFARGANDDGAAEGDGFRPVAAGGAVSEDAGAIADSAAADRSLDARAVAAEGASGRSGERVAKPDESDVSSSASRPVNETIRPANTTSLAPAEAIPRSLNVKVDPVQADGPATRETLSARVSLPTSGRLRSVASGGETEAQPALLIVAPTPVYPVSLYTKAVAGSASVEFVVDTNGRVDLSTFKSQSNHELFTEAVRHIMPDMRFVPSTANGRRVRTPMRMRFEFSKSGVRSSRQN